MIPWLQRFNAIDVSIKMLKYWKISKNFKTFYKAQTASRLKEIIEPLFGCVE